MHNQTVKTRIPTGWSLTTLGDLLIDIQAGKSLKCEERPATCDEWGVLKVSAVSWGVFKQNENKAVPATFSPPPEYEVQPGDLLMSRANTTALVGASVLVQGTRPHLMLSDKTLRLILDEAVATKPFIQIALRTRQARAYIEEHATGTSDSMKNISQETIRRIPIMLPTLPEQHTIVRRLERDMAEIERMRAAADRQRVAVEELLGAYLREIFESEEAREWPIVRLGSVGAIGSGVTLGKLYPEGQARSVPYLRVANVKDGYLDLSSIYEIAVPERDIEKSRLQFGDLLLTEGGDPDKLGRGTFWHDELQECIHQNHIFRVRFDLNRFSPQFLSAQIGSSYGKQYFLAHAKQTTGIATINQKVLANFPLMAPSTIIQREVVERIDNQMTEVKHIQQEAERQHKVIEALPEELLREVFG